MSHQSGIQCNDELRNFFAKAKDGSVRLIKIDHNDEEMRLSHYDAPNQAWDVDYDPLVMPHLDLTQATYILYRLDSKNQLGYEWIFIQWVPNNAHVRQKMLYASTRATLRKNFGDGHFVDDIFGYVPEDVCLSGYKKHQVAQTAPPPLTMAEEELQEVKRTEIRQTGLGQGHQTMKGIDFPLTDPLVEMINRFKAEEVDYCQMEINTSAELIELTSSLAKLATEDLVAQVPPEVPRYHLFRFRHNHNGTMEAPVVFIYTMPGYKCSIKERMLYSSCKASFMIRLKEYIRLNIEKTLEVDSFDELSEAALTELFHPAEVDNKPKFSKPKGPASRGPRRLIKDP